MSFACSIVGRKLTPMRMRELEEINLHHLSFGKGVNGL